MCGFVVTTRINELETLMNKQKFRGPDDTGYWADEKIGFGHVLLDINGEHQLQPFKTKKGNILVFNGEMYDSNISNDTAFLGNGLDMFGFKFISNTDFHGSFVYYDRKANKLIFGRDHFGTKPLWIHKKGTDFTITTSLRSVEHKVVNERIFNQFINNPLWIGNASPFKDTIKVAPGSTYTLDLNTNTLQHKNLWGSYRINSKKINYDDFRQRLVSSIKKVAKNKQKTGIFLSGGLDSTCALGILKDTDLDLTAYICDYSRGGAKYHDHNAFRKESKMAIQTCKEWGVPYKVVKLEYSSITHYDRMWLNMTHYPWVDMNRRAPRFALCKAASRDGCKVILTGDSADELFTGYQHHDRYYEDAYCQETIEQYSIRQKWIPRQIFSKTDHQNNSLWYDLVSTSEQNILTTDQTCGMWGMESRPVFLSQSFLRYILEINSKVKFKKHKDYQLGTYKYLLREVMKDYLPEHVRTRKQKVGWSSPWDNNHKELVRLWKLQDLEYISNL